MKSQPKLTKHKKESPPEDAKPIQVWNGWGKEHD